MGTELEIKAPALPHEPLAPAAVLAALRGLAEPLGPPRILTMEARYHDEPGGTLRTRRWTLRARREGDALLATAKGPGVLRGGLRDRVEVESPIEALPRPGDPLPEAILGVFEAAALPLRVWPQPTHAAIFERTAVDLRLEGAEAELAIDRGRVEAGDRTSPIAEVEVELKAGPPRPLLDAALRLGERLPLRPGGWSKAARGMALRGWLRPPSLPETPTLLDRFEHLVDLEERLRAGEDRWLSRHRDATEAIVAAGGPAGLERALGPFDRLRSALDARDHARDLWALYAEAIRRGVDTA